MEEKVSALSGFVVRFESQIQEYCCVVGSQWSNGFYDPCWHVFTGRLSVGVVAGRACRVIEQRLDCHNAGGHSAAGCGLSVRLSSSRSTEPPPGVRYRTALSFCARGSFLMSIACECCTDSGSPDLLRLEADVPGEFASRAPEIASVRETHDRALWLRRGFPLRRPMLESPCRARSVYGQQEWRANP